MNPEVFYAAGLAADYCSTDEGWENFISWARKEGILGDAEELSRDIMGESLAAIRLMVCQLEIDRFQSRLAEALGYEG